jgi:hypothetical protein
MTYPESLRYTITKLSFSQSSLLGSLLDLHPMFIRTGIEQYFPPCVSESRESSICIGEHECMKVTYMWGCYLNINLVIKKEGD